MAVEIAANQSVPDGSSVAVQGTVFGDTAISVVDLQARLEPLSLDDGARDVPRFPRVRRGQRHGVAVGQPR